jgi:hypothetical protein
MAVSAIKSGHGRNSIAAPQPAPTASYLDDARMFYCTKEALSQAVSLTHSSLFYLRIYLFIGWLA